MAGTETKRIIELTEASTVQSGDFIAVDSNARGTKKVSTDTLATSAALTAETNARAGADEQMSERMDGIEEQTALIQNPTKTLSGALCSFTDGADMPMVACTAEIVPKQSGTGTPSPDNVRPISGWESVNLFDTGKNLLPNKKAQVGSAQVIVGDDTASITVAQGFHLPAGSYTLLINATKTCGVYWIDKATGGNSRIGATNTPIRINVTASGYYLALLYDGGGIAVSEVNEAQLEEGSTATAYEPYTGTTHTTDLGRTVYGGTLNVASGVLTVTRGGVVYNGSENWGAEPQGGTTSFYIARQNDAQPVAQIQDGDVFTSICPVATATWEAGKMRITNGYYNFLLGSNLGISTAAEFKNYLASNPISLCYELATPQTYTLTGQEVETLLGENNVWADSGDVEITYRRDISIVINNLESALNG